jgi:hypothetical protein
MLTAVSHFEHKTFNEILIVLCHTDVCSANFALGLPDISRLVKESMHYYTSCQSGVVWSEDNSSLPAGVPERLYLSVPFTNVDPSSVKMIDLGEGSSKSFSLVTWVGDLIPTLNGSILWNEERGRDARNLQSSRVIRR